MRTAIAAPRSTPAVNFALRGAAWSIALFGLLRHGWIERHALLPLTAFQGWIAARGFGAPVQPIEVTLACSGADALALCVAATLAYPAAWSRRLAGALGGIALILTLNTVRIGTLGAATSPARFETLHLYVWPAVLTLAVAAYVFLWMRGVERPAPRTTAAPAAPAQTRRFVMLTIAFLVPFTLASSLYLESAAVLAVASFVARAAAALLSPLGLEAHATGNVLMTTRGGFLVTQECISTPLIPVYLAAVVTFAPTRRRLLLGLLAAVPIFTALGIARLLVVALPPALVASPAFVIHAFYQLVLAAVLVTVAALWRHGATPAAARRALAGAAVGLTAGFVLQPLGPAAVRWMLGGTFDDAQGALGFLPAFQFGLYAALAVAALPAFRWRTLAAGLVILTASQAVILSAIFLLSTRADIALHVRDVRALAIAIPVLIVGGLLGRERRGNFQRLEVGS